MSDDARRSAPPPPAVARRPEDWSPEQKLRAVTEAAALSERELGEFLRREGLHEAQLAEWRKAALEALGGPAKPGPSPAPSRRVRELERQLRRKHKALAEATANSPEFRNLSPKQIVPHLADRGVYIASESSFYRVLREQGLLAHRHPARPASAHRPREFVAKQPNQAWCWDITYLKSAVRGEFYFLYLVVDVYSRKTVGWSVETEESMLAAARLVEQTFSRENVGSGCLVLHADNGGPMKGSTMLATLQRLGVVPSFSPRGASACRGHTSPSGR